MVTDTDVPFIRNYAFIDESVMVIADRLMVPSSVQVDYEIS